jgi:enoyl-[acyl-carrier protein] reductase III
MKSSRVALVTGSGRGIGRTIALQLAADGADIVINFFRNRSSAEAVADEVREFGRKALVVKANVGNLEQLNELYDAIENEFGRLDIMIHNAASGYNRNVMQQRPKGWEWTMNINSRSLLFGAQRAANLMQRNGGGSIIAISSLGSKMVLPEYVVVGASKAALESIVRYLAVEFAPMGIAVNGVSPGLVDTQALTHFSSFSSAEDSILSDTARATPAGRLCTPEDVANLISFLCSPEATMIRGQIIIIDGGYSLLARN